MDSLSSRATIYVAPGTRIAHYEILSLLGAGGMAHVYLASDTRLNRRVAIKLLHAGAVQDSIRVHRFLQEARTVSALNHPNIVTIHENGECDLGLYIVMELVEGVTLRPLIAKGIPITEMMDLAIQAAQAIAVAHAADVVHRDLKPENIMVRADGYLKVLDFGLARLRVMDPAATAATAADVVLGTLKYSSPEQRMGLDVDHSSDIFSLGLVLYELAAGRHPFPEWARALHAIFSETAAPPSRFNSATSPDLDLLIGSMLEKLPSSRPTALEVVDALSALRGGQQKIPRTLITASESRSRQFVGRERKLADLMGAFRSATLSRGTLV